MSPPSRKPLARVRKPNLHSDRGQIGTRVLGDPSDPKARMVPLYHVNEHCKDVPHEAPVSVSR
ncbi:hypothetical protein E2C01_061268 [Portunus trituberculatus]|uniref:Uncharacterized protein n=1 Tax=Portunus trituberculatus TaxID=210409 RepID=A0A5B7HA95_PORTR|nr:hypothetical protein [Portunus trituberculatus]